MTAQEPDEPAFPMNTDYTTEWGISMRTYIASAALQGLLSRPVAVEIPIESLCKCAVECADKLLKELR